MNLRKWIYIKEMNIKQFCEKIGINRSYMCVLMSGKRNPGKSILYKISKETGGRVKTVGDILDAPYKYTRKLDKE